MKAARVIACLAFAFGIQRVCADDLSALSDEFDNSTRLADWARLYDVEGWGADQLEEWDLNASQPGRMVMIPFASAWYRNWHGPSAFKTVTGDFVATTDVAVSRRDGPGVPTSYSFCGLLARTPRPDVTSPSTWTAGGENYIFITIGHSSGDFKYEVKTTQNSDSTFEYADASVSGRAKVQIARIGSYFICLRQDEGGEWEVMKRYQREDMPDTLQVGMLAFSDLHEAIGYDPIVLHQTVITNGNHDLTAAFEYIRYRRPETPPGIEGLDLLSTSEVSDADLLSFLGESRFTLQILSSHGVADPGVGTYTNTYGTLLTNIVSSLDTQGTTQYVSTGWAMTGNEPSSGSTNLLTMTQTNDAVLAWQWSTNYWLDIVGGANGSVDQSDQWAESGSNLTIIATESNHYHFSAWGGDTNGCVINGNEIIAPMDGPRTLSAVFEASDSDGDGMLDWEEDIAGTSATEETEYFKIAESIVTTTGDAVICWESVTGRWYSVSLSTNPVVEGWITVHETGGDGTPTCYTNNTVTLPAAFLRLEVELQ